jgi:hypothetical protein
VAISVTDLVENSNFNPLNSELNLICHLLARAGAHHFVDVSRIRVKDSTAGQGARFFQPLALCPTTLQSTLCFNLIIESCDQFGSLIEV